MMMMVDMEKSEVPIAALRTELDELGETLQVNIHIMHERVFSAMHRI
jgi:ACT domain-containing protein